MPHFQHLLPDFFITTIIRYIKYFLIMVAQTNALTATLMLFMDSRYSKEEQHMGILEGVFSPGLPENDRLLHYLVLLNVQAHGLMRTVRSLIDSYNLIVFSPSINRNPSPFGSPMNRNIQELDESWCYQHTRFTKSEISRLHRLWHIPDIFRIERRRNVAPGETVMIVSLTYLALGEPWYRLIPNYFGGDPREWGSFFKLFINHLYQKFYHRISGDSLRWFMRRQHLYRRSLWEQITNVERMTEVFNVEQDSVTITSTRLAYPFENHRIWGLLDDYGIETCRPGDEPNRFSDQPQDTQRAFYR